MGYILGKLLRLTKLLDIQLRWRGGETDELRVVVSFGGSVLLDRTFDVIRE